MAVTASGEVPQYIQSGDTTRFTWSSGEHPASSWSAVFYLSKDGTTASANSAAAESGSSYTVTMSAATTAALSAGVYQWFIRYTETATGEIETGEQGVLQVVQNLAATPSATAAQAMLTALETAITSLAAGTNSSVSFNGQSFTKKSLGELLRWRDHLKAEVIRERQAIEIIRGSGSRNSFQVRFQ